ncbi:MAG: hypothetical protein FWC00_03515, partial [Firmicutes bacterium]|nr:hypothetical protein [Bacillota bacterium]
MLKTNLRKGLAVFACVTLVLAYPLALGFSALANRSNPLIPWSFNPPSQARMAFTSRRVEIQNYDLSRESETYDFFFSREISGWSPNINNQTTIGGAVNISPDRFRSFIQNTDYINNSTLDYWRPPVITQNNTVFMLANNANAFDSSRAHFQTEQSFELEANGYYLVSVEYMAVGPHVGGAGAFGTFSLLPQTMGGEDQEQSGMRMTERVSHGVYRDFVPRIHLPAYGGWREARFFITTDMFRSQSFKMELALGSTVASQGVIYFQNPMVTRLSREVFNDRLDRNPLPSLTHVLDLSEHISADRKYEVNHVLANAGLSNEVRGFAFERNRVNPDSPTNHERENTFSRTAVSTSVLPTYLNLNTPDDEHFRIHRAFGTSPGDVKVLMAYDSAASLRVMPESGQTAALTIERQLIYMITFYSLAPNDGGAGASMRVREHGWHGRNPSEIFDTGHAPFALSSDDDTYNGWVLNRYFLIGGTHYDVDVDIELWVGTADSNSHDFALIDEFRIQRISHAYFAEFGEGAEGAVFRVGDVGQQTEEEGDEIPTPVINNPFFNNGTIRSVDRPFPLVAQGWVHNFSEGATDEIVRSGIVSADPNHWSRHSEHYGTAISPGRIVGLGPNNNVFMMQNRGNAWQTLTSNSIPLNASSVNVITFNVQRQYLASNGLDFSVTAHVQNQVVATLDLSRPVRANGGHTTTGWETFSISIQEAAIAANREVQLSFNMGAQNRPARPGTVFIDNVRFEQRGIGGNVDADLNDPSGFFTRDEVDVHRNGTILQIQNDYNRSARSTVNTLTQSIERDMFYRYTIRVRIGDLRPHRIHRESDIQTQNPNDFVVEEIEERDWGVNFTLEGLEGGFVDLQQSDILNMRGIDANQSVALIFYITPDDLHDLSLRVTFGNDYYAVTGSVYIYSFLLEIIDRETFENAREEYYDMAHVVFITESHVPEEDITPPGERTPIQWYVIVPAVITAVAILVALIGFLVR